MDILNFISWIKGGRQVTTVDPSKTLLPVGLKDGRRDDDFLAGAITVADLSAQIGGLQTVSVDGTTITGDGTPGDPLVAIGGGPVVDSEGNLIVANSSDDTVSVGPGGTHDIPNFSGMLIVNDHFDGGVETWIAGGGDTICLGATNTGGGPVGSSLIMSGSGYQWINDSNLNGPFTFTVIKTRDVA